MKKTRSNKVQTVADEAARIVESDANNVDANYIWRAKRHRMEKEYQYNTPAIKIRSRIVEMYGILVYADKSDRKI
jgi:hypothetical protein